MVNFEFQNFNFELGFFFFMFLNIIDLLSFHFDTR